MRTLWLTLTMAAAVLAAEASEAASTAAAADESTVVQVDAESADRLARARAESVLAQRADHAATAAEADAVWSFVQPQARIDGSYTHTGELPTRNFGPLGEVETGLEDDYQFSAEVDQHLWTHGRIGASRLQSSGLRELADAELAVVLRDIGLRARTAVAAVWLARAREAVAADRVTQRQDEVADAEALQEAGNAAGIDVRQARIALIQAEDELVATEAEFAQAIHDLSVVLALPPERIEVQGALHRAERIPALLDAARTRIDAGGDLDALNARRQLQSAEQEARLAAWMPALSAFGRYSSDGESVDDLEDSWSVGLRLSWSLYDGGARWDARRAAAMRQRALSRRIEAETRRRRARLGSLATRLDTLARRIDAQETAVTMAGENYQDVRASYRAGIVTLTRVGEANLQIAEARFRLAALKHEELTASYELLSLTE